MTGRRLRGNVVSHPSVPIVATVDTFEPPEKLKGEPLAVWQELAPYAFAARTLTRATLAAFVMLCRAIVLERKLSESPLGAAGADHRGMMQRVSAGMKDFAIAPLGKAVFKAEDEQAKPAGPLNRFTNRKRA